jgi:tripartite-type tricarboxylate transporter receptor subunit TctC
MLRRFLILAAAALLPATAVAQTYPSKPIRLIVTFAPGGGADFVGRAIAQPLSEALGQIVVVDNRAGANGVVGADVAAKAAPDGYTVLLGAAGTLSVAPHLGEPLPFDPSKDFVPVSLVATGSFVVTVNKSLPVNSVEELIAYAKSRPDTLSFGSSGVGSVFQMMGELFNQTAGVRIKHVPYRGVAPAMQDVASGHIPMVFISVSNALPALQSGHVKILAVLEPTRYARLPDVRSMSEIIPAFQKPSSWFGFLGPAGLPNEMVTRLNAEIDKALVAPDVRHTLEDNGMAVIAGTPAEFDALMHDGIARYGAIIKAAGIEPE